MAKKAVATLQTGKTEGRSYTKVIKMVKSPKTGAYIFDEQMVQNDKVQDFFKKWSKSQNKTTGSSFQQAGRNFFYPFFVDVKD